MVALGAKNLPAKAGRHKRHRLDPLEKKWQPTPVFLPGAPHGQRRLAGYSPWGCKETDTTEATSHTQITKRKKMQLHIILPHRNDH